VAAERQRRERQRLQHRQHLRRDQYAMPVSGPPTRRRSQEERTRATSPTKPTNPTGTRIRQAIHQPTGRQTRHPRAGERNALADNKQPEIAGTQRAKRRAQLSIFAGLNLGWPPRDDLYSSISNAYAQSLDKLHVGVSLAVPLVSLLCTIYFFTNISRGTFTFLSTCLLSTTFGRLRLSRPAPWQISGMGSIELRGHALRGKSASRSVLSGTWILFLANWRREHLSFWSLSLRGAAHLDRWMLCFYWLRGRRLGNFASACGGAIFAYSGYMMTQLQHLGVIVGCAWIPLGLMGIDEAEEANRGDLCGKWSRHRRWRSSADTRPHGSLSRFAS